MYSLNKVRYTRGMTANTNQVPKTTKSKMAHYLVKGCLAKKRKGSARAEAQSGSRVLLILTFQTST